MELMVGNEGLEEYSPYFNKLKALTGSQWDGDLKAPRKRAADSAAGGGATKRGKAASSASTVDANSLPQSTDLESVGPLISQPYPLD